MSSKYQDSLDATSGAELSVEFITVGREVVDYSIVLLLADVGGVETVRVYDGAHGENEMHRYSRDGGKQSGTIFHSGTLGEGMRAAIADVVRGHQAMIEGWER
jgi:hypothetical protein